MKTRHKSDWRRKYKSRERKKKEKEIVKEEETLINLFLGRLRMPSIT